MTVADPASGPNAGRDASADRRDAAADARDGAAQVRDVAAARRDSVADCRDALVAVREGVVDALIDDALARDRLAEQRDRSAEARDVVALQRPPRSAEDTAGAASDRSQAELDRVGSGQDRDASAGDRADLLALRHPVGSGRAEAAQARRVAALDRVDAESDRLSVADVRDEVAADRAAAAVIPFDAFAELAAMSLAELSSASALQTVVRVSRQAIPGAVAVSVTMLEAGVPATVASSGSVSLRLDEAQYAHGHGPCVEAAGSGEARRIDDMRREGRWPEFVRVAADQGVLSALSVPLPRHAGAAGSLNVYANDPVAFGDASHTLAATLATFAAVAMGNVRLYETAKREAESIRQALVSRAVIEQAKGILMAGRGCTADEAFAILVELSQATNKKLRIVAQTLLDHAAEQRTASRTR